MPQYYTPIYACVLKVIFFQSGFLTTTVYTFLLSPIHATCTACMILFVWPYYIIWQGVQTVKVFIVYFFLHLPVTYSILCWFTHYPFCVYKIKFNILLTSTPRSSKWSLSFRLRVAILVVIAQKYVSDEYIVTCDENNGF
jgi:hypothetical protein